MPAYTCISGGSKILSGPGGLTGGGFTINRELLGGHDYSKDLAGYYSSGTGNTYSQGPGLTENTDLVGSQSRFDTTAYQEMLKSMYNTDNINSELSSLGGPPFNGDNFDRPTGEKSDGNVRHNTAVDNSVGSYADMRAYGDRSGKASTRDNNWRHASPGSDRSSSYDTLSNPFDMNKDISEKNAGSSHQVHSPFEVSQNAGSSPFREQGSSSKSNFGNGIGRSPFTIDNNSNHGTENTPFGSSKFSSSSKDGNGPFDTSRFSNNANGQSPFSTKFSSNGNGQNPFDTSKFSINDGGQSPFTANQYSSNNNGQNPFDTSKFSNVGGNQNPFGTDKFSGNSGEQNPFDTSKFLSFSGGNTMTSGQMYQTGSTDYHSNSKNTGLDEYGNIDFAKLSGLSGNSVNTASSTGMGMPSYTGTNSNPDYSGTGTMKGDYNGYSGTMDSGSYSAGTSSSQYKTPFESDNYNDLIDNPFSSSSYFDSTKNNFKDPYETKNESKDLSYAGGNSPTGYTGSGGSYSSMGSGPAGNPFHQGGQSVPSNGNMRAG